jgi:hypothetical protein
MISATVAAPQSSGRLGRFALHVARYGLVVLALALFAVSLPMPATRDFEGWGNGNVSSGWTCLLFGVLFWPSNVLLVLSPLMVSIGAVPADIRRLRLVLGCVYTASAALVVGMHFNVTRGRLLEGYYVWAAAHAAAAAALWVPWLREPRAE